MSFHGPFDDNSEVMSEINMTPMVDVMLVLLIIFMLTVPVLTHAVKLDLPKASSTPEQAKPTTVTIAIAADGKLFWNDAELSQAELSTRLQGAATQTPQPLLRIRGDRHAAYEPIAQVLAEAQRDGLSQIGLVTEPQP